MRAEQLNQTLRSDSVPVADRTTIDGLEDLFHWASELVTNGQSIRLNGEEEQSLRRRVLQVVQQHRQQKAVSKAADEIAYLQRRVIALLQRLEETGKESSLLKQVMVSQYFQVKEAARLKEELERLREIEFDRNTAREEQKELLNTISKIQKERDILDDLLRANEEENTRLSALYEEAKAELVRLRSRRWWHIFWHPDNS